MPNQKDSRERLAASMASREALATILSLRPSAIDLRQQLTLMTRQLDKFSTQGGSMLSVKKHIVLLIALEKSYSMKITKLRAALRNRLDMWKFVKRGVNLMIDAANKTSKSLAGMVCYCILFRQPLNFGAILTIDHKNVIFAF
jgi:hypothetical protein